MCLTRMTGIEKAVNRAGSRAAVARLIGTSRQAVKKMVDRGYVSDREHIEKLIQSFPDLTVAELVNVKESKQGSRK